MNPAGAEAPPGAADGTAGPDEPRPVAASGLGAPPPGPPAPLPPVQPVAAASRTAASATTPAGLVREVMYGTPPDS